MIVINCVTLISIRMIIFRYDYLILSGLFFGCLFPTRFVTIVARQNRKLLYFFSVSLSPLSAVRFPFSASALRGNFLDAIKKFFHLFARAKSQNYRLRRIYTQHAGRVGFEMAAFPVPGSRFTGPATTFVRDGRIRRIRPFRFPENSSRCVGAFNGLFSGHRSPGRGRARAHQFECESRASLAGRYINNRPLGASPPVPRLFAYFVRAVCAWMCVCVCRKNVKPLSAETVVKRTPRNFFFYGRQTFLQEPSFRQRCSRYAHRHFTVRRGEQCLRNSVGFFKHYSYQRNESHSSSPQLLTVEYSKIFFADGLYKHGSGKTDVWTVFTITLQTNCDTDIE